MSNSLIDKYNVAGPRYTSYPTVPYWDTEAFTYAGWINSVQKAFTESNQTDGISLYIHLPFCESMCTFCGCHKHITKQHSVEEPYIAGLLKEWQLYCNLFTERPQIKEIHLGGGTPTFFTPKNLNTLINGIFETADKCEVHEFSFEGHPNNTTREHLQTLYNLGFTRISFGVQDYSPTVQKAINRIQPFENVLRATQHAREIGYTSISHDLVFGLPFQTLTDVIETIGKTKELLPDRIAFYSYAHVPWIKGNGQRGFSEEDLPSGTEKREFYETGKAMLAEMGYVEIGMDHFALPADDLHLAMVNNKMHRNFMGYTASKTQLMIGLGVSSISDSWYGFAQNEKNLKKYYELLAENVIPVYRGHLLSKEDLVIRQHILNLMCQLQTNWKEPHLRFEAIPNVLDNLSEMECDELVTITNDGISVPERGRPFVRNVCMAFDVRLQRNKPETKVFSMTI